ncbi:AAA domain-containing protein [Streptomyces sp. SBC-4]|nr:AAA domain-containing protein [Streptomyces sp. SBC-4]MDV5148981.1 AAA domain-containing protein [Streptomyces sp. SBC-4]
MREGCEESENHTLVDRPTVQARRNLPCRGEHREQVRDVGVADRAPVDSQDLWQNEARILAHRLVRAVALGPDAGLPDDVIGFEPPELDRIDEVQLPETTPMVLDADASQRQCIAAVLGKRSFVMSGPPGTGKSQTITNMIAALMHVRRSVLFVSEKAAALDVVRNRLRSVGLGDFVLALHSSDTSKKAVATELARVLRPRPGSPGPRSTSWSRPGSCVRSCPRMPQP